MPFSCGFTEGRLTLTPSSEQSYAVMGTREQRPYKACVGAADKSCRTFMIHRFAIECAGVSVPWVQVIAATQKTRAGRVWLESGQLNIERSPQPSDGDAPACADERASETPSYVGGPRPSPIPRECLPWKPARQVEKMRFPEGFAPVAEVGARFLGGIAVDRVQSGRGAVEMAALGGAEDSAMMGISRESLPRISGTVEEPDPSESWKTVVEARDLSEMPLMEGSSAGMTSYMIGVLLLLGMMAAAVEVLRRGGVPAGRLSLSSFWPTPDAAGGAPASDAGAHASREFTAIADEAAAYLAEAERAVLSLRQADALRSVLEEELHVMCRRLAVLRATALDARTPGDKLGGQFRNLVRDLERVKRIAGGAAQSLAGGLRVTGKLPECEADAYDVLGVNADVGSATLKKLVDALRLTWHPDYAKDETDRQLREARIKEINVAWDLIAARRAAA